MHYFLAASVITLYIYFRFGAKSLAWTLIIFALMALSRGFVAVAIPLLIISWYLFKSTGGIGAVNWPDSIQEKMGQRSANYIPGRPTIMSKFIELYLVTDTGLISGTIIRGPEAGKGLPDLALSDCLSLLSHYQKKDKESKLLLLAYMNKVHPGWQQTLDGKKYTDTNDAGTTGAITKQQAIMILGLSDNLSEEAIKSAHKTLMKKFHPDQGGAEILAAKINMAKDKLLS